MTCAPTTPVTLRRIAANGLTLNVAEYAGPEGTTPLVLLHGIGSRGVSWWSVIDSLAASFRLIVPDLRGHGDSDKPERGYVLPDYAADLDALLDMYGIAKPLILGHSLGGLIALEWAITHPEAAAAIAIEDSPLRGGPHVLPSFDGWIALNRLTLAEATAWYAHENPNWTPEDCARRAQSITSVASGVFGEMRAANDTPTTRQRVPEFARISSPVLMVHGDIETEGMVVASDVTQLTETLPNARAVRIPGGSHSLHRDFGEPFLAAVVPFFERSALSS